MLSLYVVEIHVVFVSVCRLAPLTRALTKDHPIREVTYILLRTWKKLRQQKHGR